MRPRTEHSRLLIAIACSLLAHALAIVCFAGNYGTLLKDAPDAITAEDASREIKLGIERSKAQTIDWIGYEEYQRHLAPPSDMNQALMKIGSSQPSAPSPESEQQQPTEQQRVDPEAVARTIEQIVFEPLRALLEAPSFFTLSKPATSDKQEQSSENQQASPPNPQAPPTETVEDQEGNANKEADAFSSETDATVTEYILGKPLSAEGLDIRTVRPQWSVRTTLLANPRNPRVRIHFNKDGKVTFAVLEETTGEPDVDRPLLNAVYQWRATGERLKELAEKDPEGTISITLSIRLR